MAVPRCGFRGVFGQILSCKVSTDNAGKSRGDEPIGWGKVGTEAFARWWFQIWFIFNHTGGNRDNLESKNKEVYFFHFLPFKP